MLPSNFFLWTSLILCPILNVNAKYHSVRVVDSYPVDTDTSQECIDLSCVILLPRLGTIVPEQNWNSLCYEGGLTCYISQCVPSLGNFLDQLVKFQCFEEETCEIVSCSDLVADCVAGGPCSVEYTNSKKSTNNSTFMKKPVDNTVYSSTRTKVPGGICCESLDSTTSSNTSETTGNSMATAPNEPETQTATETSADNSTTISPPTAAMTTTTSDETITTTAIPESPPNSTCSSTGFCNNGTCNIIDASLMPLNCTRDLCLPHECYYNNHCYFLLHVSTDCKEVADNKFSLVSCQEGDKLSRGVAIETKAENKFFISIVQQNLGITWDDVDILTAGIFTEEMKYWEGWNKSLDTSVLTPWANTSEYGSVILSLKTNRTSGKSIAKWDISHYNAQQMDGVYTFCEREISWTFADPELRSSCLHEYERRACRENFCCAVDGQGHFWFSCSDGAPEAKPCPDDPENYVIWKCSDDTFNTEAPDYGSCACEHSCSQMYGLSHYKTCSGELAFGGCPNGTEGYQKWHCRAESDGQYEFEGSEPSSLCCGSGEPCRAVDSSLAVRIACPGSNTSWVAKCRDSPDYYETSRQCTEFGFMDTHSERTACCRKCIHTDSQNVTWSACPGEYAFNNCSSNTTGSLAWLCTANLTFLGQPDESQCHPDWLAGVNDLVKNGTKAETVLTLIHDHMQTDNSGIGLEPILNATVSCIDLFLKQNSRNASAQEFASFIKAHNRVLNDVTDTKFKWDNIGNMEKREELAALTINMTEGLSFSLLKVAKDVDFPYFFHENEQEAVGLALTYTTNLSEVLFPLETAANKCSVNMMATSPTSKGSLFAAVGIFFSQKTGSALFPLFNSSKTMNSAVVSLSVADVSGDEAIKQTNVGMQITFSHATRGRDPSTPVVNRRLHDQEEPTPIIGNSTCFYYNNSVFPAQWVDSGCTVVTSAAEETTCHCTHLSSFAVLVGLHTYEPDNVLETLSIVCSSLTIVSLAITLIALILVRNSNDGRLSMGKHLCICLLVAHITFVTVIDKKFFYISEGLCTFVGMFLHYFLLAAFFWMLLEAYRLYRMVVVVFVNEKDFRLVVSSIIGYGLPAVVVIITEAVGAAYNDKPYGRDELCWLQLNYIWGFNGPVFLITAVNVVVIIISMKTAVSAKLREHSQDLLSLDSLRIWVKGLVSLSALLGVTWLVGLAYIDSSTVIAYVFVILNGLQGVFILVFRCALNENIRKTTRTKLIQFLIYWNVFGMSESLSQRISASRKTGSASVSNTSDVKMPNGPWFAIPVGSKKSAKRAPVVTYDAIMRKSLQARRRSKSLKQEKNDKLDAGDKGHPGEGSHYVHDTSSGQRVSLGDQPLSSKPSDPSGVGCGGEVTQNNKTSPNTYLPFVTIMEDEESMVSYDGLQIAEI